MAVICVNTSSPEFKGLLEKTHFSVGTLKSIIHEYQNTPSLWEKGQGLWPSDDYVMNYFNRRFVGSPAQIAVWKGRFMTPHVYNTYQEAMAEKQEASKWFNEETIRVYENADGKWVVKIARPLDLKEIKHNSDTWLNDFQKDIDTTVNTGAYGRYIPNKNDKGKNVPAMDYLGKRLDNFYRQRGLKVEAYWAKNSKKWIVRYAEEEKGYVDDLDGGIVDWTEGQKNAIDTLLNFLKNPNGGRYMLLEGAAGTGKALPVDTIIPTPNGFRRFGDIAVGDYVYDRHGQPTKVTGVFPQGIIDSYTVVLSDGRKVRCNDEHIWSCYTSKGNLKDFTLRQIIDKGLKDNNNPKASFRFKIPTNECIVGTQLNLPVDPYILGVFLGNGCCKENLLTLSSADEFTVKQVADILGLTPDKNCEANYSWTFFRPEPIEGKMGKTSNKVHTDEIFGGIAEYICVEAGKKHIPDVYKLAGYTQRLSLLQGLLDTDGSIQYAGGRYNISYSTTSKQLAQDIMDIIRSLGFGCSLHIDNRGAEKYKSGVCYQINLQVSNKDKQTLFRLPRKRTIAEEAAAFSKRRNYDRVEIVDVYKNEHPEEMVCIYVDNEEHLFLANDYVVTHNTTLINEVLKRLDKGGRPHVLIGALSHKAKGVLDSKITKENKAKYMVEAKSLAGMLGMKMVMKNINGNWQEVFEVDRQARKMGIPIQSANIVFIDEASMVSEEAMAYIEELVGYGTKIVFLGDQRQLPPIRTGGTEFWNKHPQLLQNPEADSPVFTRTDIPRVSLTERVRQGEDSPIHMVTDQFGNYTLQGGQFPNLSTTESSKDLRLIIENPQTKLSEQMLPLFKEGMETQNPNFAKIVAFTNAKVNQYNTELHFLLHPEMAANRDMNFAEGDLITMYDSFTPAGEREPSVHNAEEGIVLSSTNTLHMTTRTGADIRYRSYNIKMQDGREVTLPVLEQDTPNIQAFNSALETLKKQAIADGGSWAWRPYYELKESMANMKMGYASTIHKSQGSTYQVVGVDTTNNFGSPRFKSQAIYTALTRAANISILKGMGSSNAAPSAEAISQANAEQISKRKGKKSIKDITTKGLTQEQIDHIHAETDEIATVIKQALKTVEGVTISGMPDISQPLNQIAEGTIMDATDVLRTLINSNSSAQEKALAKALIPLFSKMQINVLFTKLEDTVDEKGGTIKQAAGTTWHQRQNGGFDVRINLNSKKIKSMPSKTVLHELVHALTVNRLDNDSEFKRGIEELMDYVDVWLAERGVPDMSDWGYIGNRHYMLRRDMYGMYKPEEFLAEAMSNPYFQEVLKNIPAPEDSRLNTWQKLCKIIANAFNLFFHTKFNRNTSVYDMLIPVIADTMVVTSEQDNREAPFTEWNLDRTEQMMANAAEVVRAMNVAIEDKDVHYTPEQLMELFGGETNQIPQSYEGMITPEPNTIFVFGSNPEGRHGAGAAKTAREKFGAIYGQGEGLQGNAYALPTKDLRVTANRGFKSISPEQITENIRKMYEVARQNPDKQFKVAYTHGLNETSLNGYTGAEMIKMFKDAGPIPENVIFSKNWIDHWNEVQSNTENQQSVQSSSSTGGNKTVVKKDDTIRITRVDGTIFNAKIADIQPRVNGFSLSYISPEDGFTRVIESDINGNPVDFSVKYYSSVTTTDGNPVELFPTPKIEPTQEELFKTALKDTVERINYLEGQIGYVNNKIKYNQATSSDYTWKQECEEKLAREQKLLEAARTGKAEVYLSENNVPFLREIVEKPVEKNIVVEDTYEVSPIETKKEGYSQGVIIRKKNMQATAKQGADQIARLIEQDKLQPGTHIMWHGLNSSELAALNRVNGLNKNEDGSWTVGYTEREMMLKKQNDTLLNNPLFGSHELHKLAALTMFKLSETITQLQDGSVKIEDILMDESLTDEIRQRDFKSMDRIDIINAIGLDKLFKDVIREAIFNADINERLQEDFDLADKAQQIYDNFDAFIRLGYQELIELENISIDTERATQTETDSKKDESGEDLTDEEVVALFGSTVEHWQVGFRQVSTFSSLSKLMKQYLNRIYVLDKNGERVTDEYGVEQNIDAHEAVSKILKWTQGAVDIDDMIAKLERKVTQEPWVQQLVDLLNTDGNEQLRSQFFSNFNKYFQKYNIIYKEKQKDGSTLTKTKTINRDPFVISTLDMISSLDNSKEMGSFNLWNPRTNTIDAAAVGSLKKGAEALETIFNYKKGGQTMAEGLFNQKVSNIEKAMDSLNIPLPTREVLLQVLDSANVVKGMQAAMEGLHREFMKVPSGKADYKFMNNKTQSNYTRLIEALAPIMGDGLDSVSYEAGKLHYSYVTPSYLSKFVENMKGMRGDVKAFIESEYGNIEGWFRNKRNNVNQAGGQGWLNYWLDRMMGDTEEAKKTREKFDHIVVLSDNGTSYAAKSPVQYMASIISMYLYDDHKASAFYRIPMMSNKPSEEYIKFDRIADGYREVITDWLVDKTFAQEINRIRAVNFRNNAPAELEKLRAKKSLTAEEQERLRELEEYLKDGNPAKISGFDKNGAKFMFMEYLNQYVEDKTSELGALLRKKINGEKFDPATNESSRFTELLREAVQDNIDESFNRFLRNLALEGFIQLSPDMKVIKVNAIQDKLPLGQAKERLEEFFWNDMFASINLMQLLCTDIAYYKDTEDLQKRFAQWHSPGLRGDVKATIGGQRVTDGNTRSMYIADKVEVSDVVKTLERVKAKVLAQDRFRDNAPAKALMAAQFDKVINAFKEVNVTDAQAYTSPTGYRKKMAVFGQWTPRDEEVYQKILSGDFTAEDLDVMWQPLKPFVYSQIEKKGYNPYMPTLKMGVQQKNSEYCLILADALMRSVGEESKLTAIFDFMEESHGLKKEGNHWTGTPHTKGIDTIMFNSAVKTGLMGVLDINDPNLSHDGVVNYLKDMSGMNQGEYDDRYVHTIPFDDYCIQQYNPAHFEGEQQMGSQNRVLVFADMPNEIDGKEQRIVVDGKEVSVKQAKINYFKAIIDNIKNSGKAVEDTFDLGNKSHKMKNLAMMRVLQQEIAKDSRYGTDLQWACLLDDSGEFNIPLSDAIQSDRIQQLLNSIIKNRINKQEIAGGPVVQVSNYGTSSDLQIVRNEDGTIKYFECYVTAYDPQLYEDFGDGKGGIDMEKIEKANPKLLEMIGYRIPTEAKYSMAPLRIKGFLPKTGGEGIMLPKEITTLSGSDFDVDKMYIMRYQLDRTDNRKKIIKEIEDEYKAAGRNGIASRVQPLINGEIQPRDAADHLILSSWRSKHKIEYKDFESGKFHNDNLIIATQWGILTSGMAEDQVLSSGNFDEVKRIGYMMAAMDNGTEYATASKMSIKNLKSAAYTNKYLQYADTQMQFHKQNMVAAKLIGVFAQANVSHAIVGMSDVPAEIQIPEGGAMTINGQSYFEKNRYIVDQEYGLDNATRISSVLAQLLASSVDAVKDPVLNLLNINMDTVNVAVTLVRLGHDLEFIGLFLTHPIIKQLINRYSIEAASGSTNSLMQTLKAMQQELRGEDGKGATLQLQYNYDKGFFQREHNVWEAQNEAQRQYKKDMDLTVLELYKKLNNMAEMFRGVIHTTRYNSITSAVGPYASDTMNNRLSDEQFAANPYVTDEMRKAAEGIIYDETGKEISLIQAFRDTSSNLERQLLGDNMIQASEETYKVYKALKTRMGYMSQKMAKEFGRFYMSYYMNMETPLFDLSDEHREEMLDKFPKVFAGNKNKYRNNPFVQAVTLDKDKAGNDILAINTRGLTDTEIQALRSGWADLYTSEREKGIADKDNLAIKLVEYNFFLGSFGFNPKTFMALTPNNVKLAIPGYKESLLKQLDMNSDRINNLLMQFMLNQGYANLGTVEEGKVNFKSGDLVADREFSEYGVENAGIAKMKMKDGSTQWLYVEPISNSNDVKVYFVDKLGGENGQCFEIDPSRKVYEIQSIVRNTEPESAVEAQPDGGISEQPMVDDGRSVLQHLTPLLAAVKDGYIMDNPKQNMANLQDRFNKLYNAGQQTFISNVTGLSTEVIDKVAEVMGVSSEDLLSDVQESENKLNLCK